VIKEELIYRTNVKDIIAKLEAAILAKSLSSIKLYLQQGETLQIVWDSGLLQTAKTTQDRLEEIHKQMELAEESKVQADLEKAVEMCLSFEYFNEEVDKITQLKETVVLFNQEAALALNVCEMSMLKRQMHLAKTLGLSSNPLVSDIKTMLFEFNELTQRHVQYMVAMELGDIALIIDRQILLFDSRMATNKDKFDWKKYSGLKDPTAWAASKWTRRTERAAGFYKHTRDHIHESLTKLSNPKLNVKALECFTSIRVVMGDKIASNSMQEAKDLLVKVRKNPELKEEVYIQLMKQLTDNADPAKISKGWRLFALCLKNFTSRVLEDMIFSFIRNRSGNSSELLRLLFYSEIYRQSKKPSLEYVQEQFK
jgi:hypothetical protein